jgi:hypothetical protein
MDGKTLSTVAGGPLYWIQPKTFERRFELRAGDGSLVASLRWERACGTLATAVSAEGGWTFKRVGFLNPRVTVREVGGEENVAIYYPKFWGDGVLECPGGRVYQWRSTNFWRNHWCFADADGNVLLCFKPGRGKSRWSDLFKTQAIVDVEPQGQAVAELPLLVLLGWYLMILHQDDAAAGAAAAASAAVVG